MEMSVVTWNCKGALKQQYYAVTNLDTVYSFQFKLFREVCFIFGKRS